MIVPLAPGEVRRCRHRGPSERANASGTWRPKRSWYTKSPRTVEIGTSDRSLGSKTVSAAIATGAALAAYLLYVRPRHIRWGATDEEVERPMPGDEVVERPNFVATRAVTIEATSEEVWPWLMQIGSGRAGFYSYDWREGDHPRVPAR